LDAGEADDTDGPEASGMSDAANTTWLRKPTLPPRVKIFFPRTDESQSGASKSP